MLPLCWERQQELLHEQLVNDLAVAGAEIVKQVKDGIGQAEEILNDAEQFLAEASASLKKKKSGVPLGATHKEAVQVAADKVAAAVVSLVDTELNNNVLWATQMCEEARVNDGYVAMGTDHEGTPIRAW